MTVGDEEFEVKGEDFKVLEMSIGLLLTIVDEKKEPVAYFKQWDHVVDKAFDVTTTDTVYVTDEE